MSSGLDFCRVVEPQREVADLAPPCLPQGVVGYASREVRSIVTLDVIFVE